MKYFALVLMVMVSLGSGVSQDLPDAPAMVKAVHTAPALPIVNRFTDYRSNRWLLRADFAIRINDATSTYVMDGTGICPTCRENQLPSALAKSLPGMLMYSFAVHEGIRYGSELLWRHNHHRLARALVIGDIVGDGYAGMHNWTIFKGATPSVITATVIRPVGVRPAPVVCIPCVGH